MDAKFWQQRWENDEIAFHESEGNPLLVKHFRELSLTSGSRIFLPLCGKTRDIAWLLSHGFPVVGAELVESAIEQLFTELNIQPTISSSGGLKLYSAANISVFVGDFFKITRDMLGPVDAIYDRAALVALPEAMRLQYSEHLINITNKAAQLLITFEYDQGLMDGPPFSISSKELDQHYKESYVLTLAASIDVPGGLKGKCAATENVWLLR